MTKDTRVQYSFLAFILGFGLRLTPILNIIHELMHHGFANAEGIKVLEMNWSSIVYARESVVVLYGGYVGEFLLYSTLVFFLSIGVEQAKSYKIKPGHKVAASFFLGILLVAWCRSFISTDFNTHALRIMSQAAATRQKVVYGIWTSISMIVVLKSYFTRWE